MNVGDNVYCEFELQKIKTMNSNRITAVSDGYFEHSSFDLSNRCFETNKKIKNLSETFYGYYDEIRKSTKPLNINFPDIHEYFIQKWVDACNGNNESILDAERFKINILIVCSDVKRMSIDGVRVFRD